MVDSTSLHVLLKVTGTVDVGLPDESEELLVVENGKMPLPGIDAEEDADDDAVPLELDTVTVEFELDAEEDEGEDVDAVPLELELLDTVTVDPELDAVVVELELLEPVEPVWLGLEVRDTDAVELELTEAEPLVAEELVVGAVPDRLDSGPEILDDDELKNTLEEELDNVNGGNVTVREDELEVTLEEFVEAVEFPCTVELPAVELSFLTTKACDRAKRLRNAKILAILNERWRNDGN